MLKEQTERESTYLGASYNVEASTAGQAPRPRLYQGVNHHSWQVAH